MLYVTTKNGLDAYTSHRALTEQFAPDGGNYIPFRLNSYTREELECLLNESYCHIVAKVLNVFFSCNLTERDVELCVGQTPGTVHSMNHRIHIVELWNNPRWSVDFAIQSLGERMGVAAGSQAGYFAGIAVQTALLFGAFGQLYKNGTDIFARKMEVAAASCDFAEIMAVLYTREMGLPIGKIICGSNENSGFWDLLNHGQIRTGTAAVNTDVSLCDRVIPRHLPDTLFRVLGRHQAISFDGCVSQRGSYTLSEDDAERLTDVFFSAVVGGKRMNGLIASVYSTNRYLLDPYAAIAYGALQDYRSRGGEIGDAIVLSRWCAEDHRDTVAKALGVSPDRIASHSAWGGED